MPTSGKLSKSKVGKLSSSLTEPATIPGGGTKAAWSGKQARDASIILKHISDPTRLQILLILSEGDQNVDAICKQTGKSQPAVSHHLALLRHGAIIAPRRRGTQSYYGVTDTGRALTQTVQSLLVPEPGVLRSESRSDIEAKDDWSQKNLRRAELIFKKNQARLTSAERSELAHLQALSVSRMQRDFPGPSHIEAKLRRIEKRLGSDEADKV